MNPFARRVQGLVQRAERTNNIRKIARHQLALNDMAGNAKDEANIEALERAYARLQNIYDKVSNSNYNNLTRRSPTRRPVTRRSSRSFF